MRSKSAVACSRQEWSRIEPHLPRGRRGAHRVDDRRVISGIVHMLRSGARWRDGPPEYGPDMTASDALVAVNLVRRS